MTDKCPCPDDNTNSKKRRAEDSDVGPISSSSASAKRSKEKDDIAENVAATVPTALKQGENKEEPKEVNEGEYCFDVFKTLNLEGGDRLELLWCLAAPGEEDETAVEEGSTERPMTTDTKEETRWWGATLLPVEKPVRYFTFSEAEDEEDDESPVSSGSSANPSASFEAGIRVPIRVLDYDPYIEGGFPENSLNEVAFLS